MKLHDYHNTVLSKLLCFTKGTEPLGAILEGGYKIFKGSQLKHNLTFTGLCTIIYFYSKTNQMYQCLKFILL